MTTDRQIVGLIPAGGTASRISPLPCSKEIYPIGFEDIKNGRGVRSKTACQYLLEKIKYAGINTVFIVIRKDKCDIPAYLGDGNEYGVHVAYLIMGIPFGTPYTLDQAYPFIKDAHIAFGFADIIFQPDDAYVRLLDHQKASNADVVLGVFTATDPSIMDMVDLDKNGRVRLIEIKPMRTRLQYTWFIAVWTPAFTHFMHEYLLNHYNNVRKNSDERKRKELYMGDIIQAAINNSLLVESVLFSETDYIDIGTPQNLMRAVRNFS